MSSGEWIMDNLDPLNFSTEEEYYEYHNNTHTPIREYEELTTKEA